MPFVDFRLPAIPAASQVYVEQSLASLQPVAGCAVHLIAWRFRRLITAQWTWADANWLGYSDAPPGADTRRVRWHTSPLAEFLWVAFRYQARDDTGAPAVAMSLYNMAGALQDGPVTLQAADGTLPVRTISSRTTAWNEYPHMMAHTGTDERAAADNRPGLIRIPTGVRGADVELRLACTDVRLRAATIWEFPTVEI